MAESRDGHFHFDVCTDGVIVEDKDGLDLLNAATARLEAVRAAAEMMKDRCADMAQRANICIAVRTQSLEPVCTVQVALGIRPAGSVWVGRLRFEPAAPAQEKRRRPPGMLLLKDRRPPAQAARRINRPRAHQRRRTLEVQCLVAAASDIIAVARNASR